MANRHESLVLFLGAGASLAAPANLPLFAQIRHFLFKGLEIDEDKFLEFVAPESLLFYMNISGVPVVRILQDILGVGKPNAIHKAVANALTTGASVWTTNVDELIEEALGWSYNNPSIAIGKTLASNLKTAKYFKLHGTLSSPTTLAFKAPQVLRPLAKEWVDQLLSDLKDSQVIIVGYSGVDPDIQPILKRGLMNVSKAVWYELPNKCKLIESRFKEPIQKNKLKVLPTKNPSVSFFEEMERRGLTSNISIEFQNYLKDAKPHSINLSSWNLNQYHLASARLYEHIGLSHKAIIKYKKSIVSGSISQKMMSLFRLIGVYLYQKK